MIIKARAALVYSNRDPAGIGIAEHVKRILGLKEHSSYKGIVFYTYEDIVLAGFDEDVIYFEFLDNYLNAEYYIVLSRHSSKARIKSLTVHHTGNPTSRADAGGKPRELAIAFPPMAKKLITLLNRYAVEEGLRDEYDVTLEVTHHGPTSPRKPLVFIEIGSTPDEWRDEKARKVIAQVVADAVTSPLPECTPATGFGGGHYARKHTRVMLNTEYCLGHIFSKHVMDEVDEDTILQAFSKSVPPSKCVVIEKKGVKSLHRKLVKRLAEEHGLCIVEV